MNFNMILVLFMILVAVTNIIVNVIKAVCEVKRPQRVVVLVAIMLAMLVAITSGIYLHPASWYVWAELLAVAVLLGMLVAYVAMYGYDQGYGDLLLLVQRLISYITGGSSAETAEKASVTDLGDDDGEQSLS